MADEVIHYRFRVRGGTAQALANRNESPLDRELVVAKDTGRMKLGDGSTAYNDLPYIGETERWGHVTAAFDGGSDEIEVGARCSVFVPFGFAPAAWVLLVDSNGHFEVDVRAGTYAEFPVTGSICGPDRPRVEGARKAQGAPLSSWSLIPPSGAALEFVVTACAGITRASLVLRGDKKWEG